MEMSFWGSTVDISVCFLVTFKGKGWNQNCRNRLRPGSQSTFLWFVCLGCFFKHFPSWWQQIVGLVTKVTRLATKTIQEPLTKTNMEVRPLSQPKWCEERFGTKRWITLSKKNQNKISNLSGDHASFLFKITQQHHKNIQKQIIFDPEGTWSRWTKNKSSTSKSASMTTAAMIPSPWKNIFQWIQNSRFIRCFCCLPWFPVPWSGRDPWESTWLFTSKTNASDLVEVFPCPKGSGFFFGGGRGESTGRTFFLVAHGLI